MTEAQEKPVTSQQVDGEKKKSADSKREASWPSVLFFIHLNILGLYGIVVLFTNAKIITIVFCEFQTKINWASVWQFSPPAFILTLMGIYGSTVGAHRLWAHQTFKANGFLRFWLMISQTMAGQVRRTKVSSHARTWTFDIVNFITKRTLIYSLPFLLRLKGVNLWFCTNSPAAPSNIQDVWWPVLQWQGFLACASLCSH